MTTSADHLDPGSLETLLLYYRDAGVDVLLDELPVDRFAESAETARQREATRQTISPSPAPSSAISERRSATERVKESARATPTSRPAPQVLPGQMTVPNKAAIADAQATAAAANTIDELRAALEGFSGCNLKHSARNTVFADGSPQARLMIIGEAPDGDEDMQGLPFAGSAGQLLDRMLAAVGLDRQTTYITNVLAWRPPGNRKPTEHEIELCRPFVERHIALVKPEFLLLLGNVPVKALLKSDDGILSARGKMFLYDPDGLKIPAMVSLNPVYLLRDPAQKKSAWLDLLALTKRMADKASNA